MKNSILFVKNLAFSITFMLLELPKKNGVVERKNRSLEELARTSPLYQNIFGRMLEA